MPYQRGTCHKRATYSILFRPCDSLFEEDYAQTAVAPTLSVVNSASRLPNACNRGTNLVYRIYVMYIAN